MGYFAAAVKFAPLHILCWLLASAVFAQAPVSMPYGFHAVDSDAIPNRLKSTVTEYAKGAVLVELRDTATGKIVNGGTGFVVPPGNQMLTALHVVNLWVKNREAYTLKFFQNGDKELEVLSYEGANVHLDSALFKLAHPYPHVPVALGATYPEVGDRVANIGFDFWKRRTVVSFGFIGQKKNRPNSRAVHHILSAPSLAGMSGGMTVLLAKDGSARGVVGTNVGFGGFIEKSGLQNVVLENQLYVNLDSINEFYRRIAASLPKTEQEITSIAAQFESHNVTPQFLEVYRFASANLREEQTLLKLQSLIEALEAFQQSARSEFDQKEFRKLIATVSIENFKLLQAGILTPPLMNFPFFSLTGLREFEKVTDAQGARAEIAEILAVLKDSQDQVREQFKAFRTKIDMHESADSVCKFVLANPDKVLERSFSVPARMLVLPEL